MLAAVRALCDRTPIRSRYRRLHGQAWPDVPTTFTQKLFRRMAAWDECPPSAAVAWTDKLHAKECAERLLGPGHVAQLYWAGTDAREIPFGELPLPHVLKGRHGSKMNRVIREDPDQFDLIATADQWMARNYYDHAREGQYRAVPRGLMIEACLTPTHGPLLDYKFWCFHGKPVVCHVDNPDQSINPFYDTGWNLLDLHYRKDCPRPRLERPGAYDQMREMAARLSTGWDFVRVDLFSVDGQVYFSEMTFTPNAGGMRFLPESWDATLGSWWE